MAKAEHVCSVLIAALLLACCTGCPTQVASSAYVEQIASGAPAEQSAAPAAVTVKALSPQRTTLRRTTTQPATIRAYYQAEVYAKVAGYLEELKADIGQHVDAGAVLGTIAVPELVKSREKQEATIRRLQADEKRAAAEITVAQANVESAKAALEQARADVTAAAADLKAQRIEHERVDDLVENKAVAERLRDETLKRYESAGAAKSAAEAGVVSANANLSVAKAKLEAAQADLATARARTEVASKELEEIDALMSYATLQSPFQGVVTERHADPGDLIRNAPSSSGPDSPPLFVIAELDKVRVRVTVPENQTPWANEGDAVTLVAPALPDRKFEGKIDRIARSLDHSTRTMTVEADLPNPDYALLPGMYAEATIELDEKPDALVLPAGAVRYDEEGHSRVYVVDQDNAVQVVDVSTGLDDGKRIEILSGLDENARVIDAMAGRLAPGQRVSIQAD
jgi:RND family efflux transporter MFP subunit